MFRIPFLTYRLGECIWLDNGSSWLRYNECDLISVNVNHREYVSFRYGRMNMYNSSPLKFGCGTNSYSGDIEVYVSEFTEIPPMYAL